MKKIILFILIFFVLFFTYKKNFYFNGRCSENINNGLRHDDFYVLIDQYSEKRIVVNENGTFIKRIITWKDSDNIYNVYYNDIARKIDKSPESYLSDAVKVLSGSQYDQSQKLYSVLLMQHLPINDYICLMNVANEIFESDGLDKEVMRFVLFPDPNIKNGISVYYWWLPAWREQFRRNAYKIADEESIDKVLNGKWSFNLLM